VDAERLGDVLVDGAFDGVAPQNLLRLEQQVRLVLRGILGTTGKPPTSMNVLRQPATLTSDRRPGARAAMLAPRSLPMSTRGRWPMRSRNSEKRYGVRCCSDQRPTPLSVRRSRNAAVALDVAAIRTGHLSS